MTFEMNIARALCMFESLRTTEWLERDRVSNLIEEIHLIRIRMSIKGVRTLARPRILRTYKFTVSRLCITL